MVCAIFTDMGKVDELTILEIAEIKNLHFETVKARIRILGIKPVRKVGRTNVYDKKILDEIDNINPPGPRPNQPPDPEPEKPAKGKSK